MRINPVDPVYKLYKENVGLVYRCLKHMEVPEYCEGDDLLQAGSIGLFKAIQKYDLTRGTRLSTYAFPYIKGYILKEIYKNLSLISRIGINSLQKAGLSKLPVIKSLSLLDDEDEGSPSLQIPDNKDDVGRIESELDYYKLRKLYNIFFNLINPKQRRAIELYYFTVNDYGNSLTYKEVGKILGVTPQRAEQLIRLGKNALKKRFGEYLNVYI